MRALFGLLSAVALTSNRLIKTEVKPARVAARYEKQTPTIADAMAAVRRWLWSGRHFSTPGNNSDVAKISRSLLGRLNALLASASLLRRLLKLSPGAVSVGSEMGRSRVLIRNERLRDCKDAIRRAESFLVDSNEPGYPLKQAYSLID
jgi:hypothetical protein